MMRKLGDLKRCCKAGLLGLTMVQISCGEAEKSDAVSTSEADKGETQWIQLFNGKDLTGWTPKFTGHELGVNLKDTFRVEDGLLKVSYDNWEKWDGSFGHLFYQDEFSNYRLRVEYRFVGEQVPGAPGWARLNNGLMVHGQKPESMALDQDFPDSLEVQLLGANEGETRGNGNLCTPGTHVVIGGELVTRHVIDAGGPSLPAGEWVVVEAEVRGNEVLRHFVNGEQVLEYHKPQLDDGTPLNSGTISIQAESAPCEFRKIELLPLED